MIGLVWERYGAGPGAYWYAGSPPYGPKAGGFAHSTAMLDELCPDATGHLLYDYDPGEEG